MTKSNIAMVFLGISAFLLICISRFDVGTYKATVARAARKRASKNMFDCPDHSDCWKFQKLITKDWNKDKPRAAIYIFAQVRDRAILIKTLKQLQTNFISNYSYPIIIFHTTNFAPYRRSIRKSTKARLFFQEVQFNKPPFLDPPANVTLSCLTKQEYKYIHQFHAKVIYDLPIMRNLEYCLRLNIRTYKTIPVPYDLFKFAKEKDVIYMYPAIKRTITRCVKYIIEATRFYSKVKNITPHFMDKMISPDGKLKIFASYFELIKMDFFTSVHYQNYIKYIDSLGGMFYHGWGDAPLKTMAVSLFVPENQTLQIQGFAKSHESTRLTKV